MAKGNDILNTHALKRELRRLIDEKDIGMGSAPFEQTVLDSIEQHERIIILQRKKIDIAVDLLKGAGGAYYRFYNMLVAKKGK